jgi:hypothetical protein
LPSESVHHLDSDTSHNSPANLRLIIQGEHARTHLRKHPLVLYCKHCDDPFLNNARRSSSGVRCCARRCFALCRTDIVRQPNGWFASPAAVARLAAG